MTRRLTYGIACCVALASAGGAYAQSWFVGRDGASVGSRQQRALVHFQNGREVLILEARFQGPSPGAAWIVALPSHPDPRTLRPEVSPFEELAYLTDPVHRSQIGPHPPETRRPVSPSRYGPNCIIDSTVLESQKELDEWLRGQGFPPSPAGPAGLQATSFAAFQIDPSRLPEAEGEDVREGWVGPIRLAFETDQPICPLPLPDRSGGASHVSLYVFAETPMVPAGPEPWPSFDLNVPPANSRDPATLEVVTDSQFGTYRRMGWPEPHLAYLALGMAYDASFHVSRYEFEPDDDSGGRALRLEPMDPAAWWSRRLVSCEGRTERLQALAVLAQYDDARRDELASLREQPDPAPAARAAPVRELADSDRESDRVDAAGSPDLSLDVLRRLAEDSSPAVRAAVAARRDLAEELLARLLDDEDAAVRRAAARNPLTPAPQRVKVLLEQGDVTDHVKLAGDRTTSVTALLALGQSKHAAIRRAVAANPGAPPQVLRSLASDGDRTVRSLVAAHPATPSNTLDSLAADSAAAVRRAVAANEATSEQTLRRLAEDRDSLPSASGTPTNWVKRHVASRTAQSRVLKTLASDQDPGVRARVAANPRTPALVLARLMTDNSLQVRQSLLSRRDLRADRARALLTSLAQDVDVKARLIAAGHPHCPSTVLDQLAEDRDAQVRAAVAANPRVSPLRVHKLATDQDAAVRSAVAANPHTNAGLLRRLAEDPALQATVAANPAAPVDLLDRLAGNERAEVRGAVARNPQTAPETLRRLSRDAYLEVARQAVERLESARDDRGALEGG